MEYVSGWKLLRIEAKCMTVKLRTRKMAASRSISASYKNKDASMEQLKISLERLIGRCASKQYPRPGRASVAPTAVRMALDASEWGCVGSLRLMRNCAMLKYAQHHVYKPCLNHTLFPFIFYLSLPPTLRFCWGTETSGILGA